MVKLHKVIREAHWVRQRRPLRRGRNCTRVQRARGGLERHVNSRNGCVDMCTTQTPPFKKVAGQEYHVSHRSAKLERPRVLNTYSSRPISHARMHIVQDAMSAYSTTSK